MGKEIAKWMGHGAKRYRIGYTLGFSLAWLSILFEIWILSIGIYLLFGACKLLFPVYRV